VEPNRFPGLTSRKRIVAHPRNTEGLAQSLDKANLIDMSGINEAMAPRKGLRFQPTMFLILLMFH